MLLNTLISVENIMATHSKYLLVAERGKEDPVSAVINVQIPLDEIFDDPIDPWIALFAKYININTTFIWLYSDIFLMSVSMGLASQFKIFNDALKSARNEVCFHLAYIN